MTTGIVKDWRYLEHDMGPAHPESPDRIRVINEMLEKDKALSTFPVIAPRPATAAEIELIHTRPYHNLIRKTAGRPRTVLDPDTSTSAKSYETALLAAGGTLRAAEMIMEKSVDNAFALVRPPGHHAEAGAARGFCIFNNAAIAAEHLVRRFGLKRLLIVDWDLHHGNGTQHSFEERDDVLYFSTHQFPFYPGSGHWSETGRGKGEGFTVNVPLAPGKTDGDFLHIFRRLLGPIARAFRPEFIIVSAGFDIFAGDPLGGMEVTLDGFGALAADLQEMAGSLAAGRVLAVLEGGYNLIGLREGVKRVLQAMADPKPVSSLAPRPTAAAEAELAPVLKAQKKYWPVGP
jgi:acetoin utilization deacetylase AcuC-like enzyme